MTNTLFFLAGLFLVAGLLAQRQNKPEYVRNWNTDERRRMLIEQERRRRAFEEA